MDEKLIRDITLKVLQGLAAGTDAPGESPAGIPIGVSGRHVHLSRAHMDALFGRGSELTFKKELMGGQFAAQECVTIAGQKKTIANVRVLGPLRPFSQVEIAQTDSFGLGIKAPLRDSGDIKGSAPIAVIGPRGALYLDEGCIVARRHIHMPPDDARRFNVRDKDVVSVRVPGARGGVYDGVLVRVDASFTLEMHIDTDEANGFGITTGELALIV